MMNIPRAYIARLRQREQLTATVFRFLFETTEPLTYVPGQYASWLIGPHRRPMSFAIPANDTRAEFVVDTSPGGVASQFSLGLKEGDMLNFLAPYGQFIIDQADTGPRLFLATGTGIAPIRAQLLADQSSFPSTLIFGTRSPEHRFLDDELRALARERANLTYLPVCGQADRRWAGAVGHAAELALSIITRLSLYQAYVCGAPAFVEESTRLLLTHGLPAPRIHTEQYAGSYTAVR